MKEEKEERRNENHSLDKIFEKNARWLIEDAIGRHDERIQLHFTEAPVINSNFELLYNF